MNRKTLPNILIQFRFLSVYSTRKTIDAIVSDHLYHQLTSYKRYIKALAIIMIIIYFSNQISITSTAPSQTSQINKNFKVNKSNIKTWRLIIPRNTVYIAAEKPTSTTHC